MVFSHINVNTETEVKGTYLKQTKQRWGRGQAMCRRRREGETLTSEQRHTDLVTKREMSKERNVQMSAIVGHLGHRTFWLGREEEEEEALMFSRLHRFSSTLR
jgi:hypothetical protein